MIKYVALFQFLCIVFACTTSNRVESALNKEQSTKIICNDTLCYGTYSGPEFVDGSDVAHQFSNQMAAVVGNKLKELYRANNYSKVDLQKIKMTTLGMYNKGEVEYALFIPFIKVEDSCEAKTSFDHRGGWGHKPNLDKVLTEFAKVKSLEYQFTTTPEGLTEYWLQWRHNQLQANCTND